MLRLLRERVGPDLTIIAVGGIGDADDARERLDAGATLLQAYTALRLRGRAAGRPGCSASWPADDRHGPGDRPGAGHRGGAERQARRRLPPPDAGRARGRRSGSGPAPSSPSPSAAPLSRPRCAARCPMHRVRPTGAYGGTVECVFAVDRRRHRVAGRRAAPAPRSTSSARWAGPFALPKEPVTCVLVGEGCAQRAAVLAWPSGCASATAPCTCCSARGTEAAPVRRARGPAGHPRRHGRHRGRLGRHARRRRRRAARPAHPHRRPTWSTPPARTTCCTASRAAAETHGAWSQTAVDVPDGCGTGLCLGCVLPVVGEDGVHPDGPRLHRGPGLPRRPGAVGRPRHRPADARGAS